MAMQAADVAPTASEVANADRAKRAAAATMLRWNTLRTSGLSAYNAKRRAAGAAPLVISP
jgi:hypothetical protein